MFLNEGKIVMGIDALLMVLIIFSINIVYVTFFTVRAYEPNTIHGGFWVKTVRKGKLFK